MTYPKSLHHNPPLLYIALGSLSELETQVIIAGRLGYLTDSSKLSESIEVIRKLINGLIYSLKRGRGKNQ